MNSRGRSGWGAGSAYGTSGAGSTGRSTQGSRTSSTSPKYKGVCNSFQAKIDSYKTLYNQASGPAKHTRPSPTVLNSFANWINKGAIVQVCSKAQVSRWARTANKSFNTRTSSPTTCKNVLSAKFGKTTIKAVACTKTGSYMVATTPTWKGKPFCFPK